MWGRNARIAAFGLALPLPGVAEVGTTAAVQERVKHTDITASIYEWFEVVVQCRQGAKCINEQSDFNTLFRFLTQPIEHHCSNLVEVKQECLDMDELFRGVNQA